MAISTDGLADVFPYFPEWATDYYEDAEGGIWVFCEDTTKTPYMVWHPSNGRMAGDTSMRLTNMDLAHGRRRGPFAGPFLKGYAQLLLRKGEEERKATRLAQAEEQAETVVDPDQCSMWGEVET